MRLALITCREVPPHERDDAPLHDQLLRRGHEVRQAVWDDPAVPWWSYDAALIRTTWDYAHQRTRFVEVLGAIGEQTRLLNPAGLVAWNTDKRYLLELAAAGVDQPPTRLLEGPAPPDLAAILRAWGAAGGLVKPVFGASARETLPFGADAAGLAQAEAHLARLLPTEPMLLQPFLKSVFTAGERSAVFFDGHFSHAVRKIPVQGDFRVQDDYGATDEPTTLNDAERALCARALAVLPEAPLYARVDWLGSDSGQPLLVELELVEPSLFFRHGPGAAARLVEALERRVAGSRHPRAGRRAAVVGRLARRHPQAPVAPPIEVSVSFERPADGLPGPLLYRREGSPAQRAVEDELAALEGGAAAALFASGQAATAAVLHGLKPGDEVLATADAYGGTGALLELAEAAGVRVRRVPTASTDDVRAALGPMTRLVWVETPSNPLLQVADLPALGRLLGERGVPWAVDNTLLSSWLQQPLRWGARWVVHSATKHLAGHSDALAGVVVCAAEDDAFHAVRRWQQVVGAAPGSLETWLVGRGLATLPARIEAACLTAERLVRGLTGHPALEKLRWPGHADGEQARRVLVQQRHPGPLFAIEVRGGRAAALRVARRLRAIRHATSLGDVHTLVEHRASLPREAGVPEGLLRFSVGQEDAEALLEDLRQALDAAVEAG